MTHVPARNFCGSSTLAPAADRADGDSSRLNGIDLSTLRDVNTDPQYMLSDGIHDCLIIGAGPAGLTAATYLSRYRRHIAVIDAGHSRARWIPSSHNCPGFPFGVAGPALLHKLREQAEGYGAVITPGRVVELQREEADGFVARDAAGQQWRARLVLLASGIVDRMPQFEGGEQAREAAIAAGVLRVCAVCDGYEATDDCLAVLAPADEAIRHALFLRTYSRRVDAICSVPGEPSPECAALARAAGVTLRPPPLRLRHAAKECIVDFVDGTRRYDSLYPVLGGVAQSQLAAALGARLDDNRELVVDPDQQTSVDGLYAIGDLVSALNQISVAVGHAAIAATAIHHCLPRNFREDDQRPPPSPERLP